MNGSNTADSDITMKRTRKRAWRNEQQVSTNKIKAVENLKTYFDSKFDDIRYPAAIFKRKRKTCQQDENGLKI